MKFKIFLLVAILFAAISVNAQSHSPFKKYHPNQADKMKLTLTAPTVTQEFSAYRFTGPMASSLVNFRTGQVAIGTGAGYGYQKFHYNSDSSIYVDFGVVLSVFASGAISPSFSPFNLISAGPQVQFLNDAITVGPIIIFPANGQKTQFGLSFNFSSQLF